MSPHVTLAARLERAAAAVYGVTLLLSGAFVDRLAAPARDATRQVDRARLRGASSPTTLHTYDFAPADRQAWADAKAALQSAELSQLFDLPDRAAADAFLEAFAEGRAAYLDGHWSDAYDVLFPLLERHDDNPLRAVVNFMASNGNICPPDWRGYRCL